MERLDRECWRCGAPGVADDAGRVLCPPCRAEVLIGAWPSTGRRHGMDWYLDHCWRCEEAEVPSSDDLGLCASCRVEMAGSRRAS